jgi:superfamily II DNA or RNA helicase
MANAQIPAAAIRDFLSVLEQLEMRLLGWGVIDGAFSEDELDELADTFVAERKDVDDPETLIDALVEEGVLCEFNIHGRHVYRTRMAETVRLLARLRQQFPNRDWRIAPTLVSDYRFVSRPRRYPNRNITPEVAVDQVRRDVSLNGLQQSALSALLRSPARTLTLSDFQVRATAQVLRDVASNQSRGMIVCAGTGSGKTLAFYLPTLTYVASLVKRQSHFTKVLAIYPRNELLKDQFSEAYRDARLLDSQLLGRHERKITLGAFFGPTPRRARLEDIRDEARWTQEGSGFVCPYLRCPRCEGALAWSRADIEARRECLECVTDSCRARVESDEVILTRERLAQTPPDLLFTTTETLNRQLSSAQYGAVFGLGIPAHTRPKIMLLDEVHTYAGVHGAQVANLLRRWRHAVGAPVQFTGLSATLRGAVDFFSRLTGLHTAVIEEISPVEDLIDEGMEYLLALRGDPVSGASLLSTTIQAAMLLRRMLEPNANTASRGVSGRRVYVFTDDLDVTNRLYHNLLDAEGRDGSGVPVAGREPLAALRSHARAEPLQRLLAGQSWKAAEAVGHQLARPLVVTRTSSQDTGVARDADIIVATASLEVGYNDPEVGAVIQHKAPRDTASFLQRKGRAGRRRSMRPWAVAVLSDYGRDRLAYQGYELLFDPILEPNTLPVGNRYVLRIQAVYSFMDWVAKQLPPSMRSGSVWRDFSGPADSNFAAAQTRQQWEAGLIRRLLDGGELGKDLATHLSKALRVDTDEVSALLWEPPRALMTATLPTLLRRLDSGWRRQPVQVGEAIADHLSPTAPLPDFIPENLFSDLNLPEITVLSPRSGRQPDVLDETALPIVQGLRALAPGNVTRRFAPHRSHVSHWIAPPSLDVADQPCAVGSICAELDELGTFQVYRGGVSVDIRCVRPWVLRPSVVPFQILSTSRGALTWASQLYPTADGLCLEAPRQSPWSVVVREIRFYTHNQRAHATVRRFALEAHANIRFKKGAERDLRLRFVDDNTGDPVGIGFAKSVDAIVFRFTVPAHLYIEYDGNTEKSRASRAAYFRHSVQTDTGLSAYANGFQREWLAQIYLSALTARALATGTDVRSACASLTPAELARVLDVIFQTLDVEERDKDEPSESGDSSDGPRQRVHQVLLDLCGREEIQVLLRDLASTLWAPPDEKWRLWLEDRFASTLGGALLSACQRLCPQSDAGDLVLDLAPGPRPAGSAPLPAGVREIWITEDTVGGAGIVEEVLQRYVDDPARVFRFADAALEPSDFEWIDSELTRLLALLTTDAALSTAVRMVRSAADHKSLTAAVDSLRSALESHGLVASRAVMSALQIRVLRPGSSDSSDALLHRLISAWRDSEERLGVEVDARVFAYIASISEDFGEALAHIEPAYRNDPRWRCSVIYSLLWPRGHAIRARALTSYQPFASLPETDRELLVDCVAGDIVNVKLEGAEWMEQVTDALSRRGSVRLIAEPTKRRELRDAVLQLAAQPLEIGFLHLHPQVDGIRSLPDGVSVILRLREALQ